MWPSSGALGPLGSVCGLPAWGEEDAPHGGAWVDGMVKSVAAGAQGGMTPPATCPKCGASWLGDPIPEAIAQDYSDTHWRREFGIYGNRDRVMHYQCPDCKALFHRDYRPVTP